VTQRLAQRQRREAAVLETSAVASGDGAQVRRTIRYSVASAITAISTIEVPAAKVGYALLSETGA
jgi:hypothetical protein